jgi:hydrogenase/urease accessory protein HupE
VKRLVAFVALLCALFSPRSVSAHPLHFGSLVVRDEGDRRYAIGFRYSGTEDRPGDAPLRLPADCRELAASQEYSDSLGITRVMRIRCATPLEGRGIGVTLTGSDLQVLASFEARDGRVQREMLSIAHAEMRIGHAERAGQRARRFFVLGIEHIGTGLDHLAFVLALLVLVRGRKRIVATITAFTAGHSLTLGAAALGVLRVPQAPTEALIALSIVLVANEITNPEHETLARRSPWLVAGLFGLVHGLGFASALSSTGLARGEIPLALAAFNLGVEAGQLAFVAMVAVIAAWALPRDVSLRRDRAVAYIVGSFGMYLAFDRLHTVIH